MAALGGKLPLGTLFAGPCERDNTNAQCGCRVGGMTMFRVALLACAGMFASAVSTGAFSSPMPLDQAAKLFGARPSGFAPDLSPNGDKMVYLSAGPGASTIAHLRDLEHDTDKIVFQSGGKPLNVEFCGFVDERWIVCSVGGEMHEAKFVYPVGRTLAIDTTTGAIRWLSAVHGSDEFLQFDGRIIDWLPDEPGNVLMQRNHAPSLGAALAVGVDRIQIDPFRISTVEPAQGRDLDYMTDGHGTVRFRGEAATDADDDFTGLTTYQYRSAGDAKWAKLPNTDPDFTPLAVDRASNSLYFLRPLNGRAALYKIQLDGSATEKLIASNSGVDIDTVIRLGPGEPVVGYRYTDERTRSVYTDPAIQSLGNALAKALPDMPLINFVAISKVGDKVLLHAGSDVDPGEFFLLDRKTRRMDPVLNSNDFIDGKGLAPMKAVEIPTADGKSIPAYVTMRADLGGGPHPTVVMPHGGPSARDAWGFDWLGQFIAARGYVVIQPNFRGSSGYGKDFLGENAFHEWRKVMSDIRDFADWLVKQGLSARTGLDVDWSYG